MRIGRPLLPALAVVLLAACNADVEARRFGTEVADGSGYPTVIHTPPALEGLATSLTAHDGTPVSVRCGTCHDGRPADELRRDPATLDVHAGLTLAHGPLTCGSCHAGTERDRLRLADGTTLEMIEATTLCAQCHGPQYRDYSRGSHGGMAGFWDTRRGERERNHCIDCHDPHAPAFGVFSPAPAPRDRGLMQLRAHDPHANPHDAATERHDDGH